MCMFFTLVKQKENGVNTLRNYLSTICFEAHSSNQMKPNEGQLSITNQISGELYWISLSAYSLSVTKSEQSLVILGPESQWLS